MEREKEKRSWVGGWWCWCGETELSNRFLSTHPLLYLRSYAERGAAFVKDHRGHLHCETCKQPVYEWAVSVPEELAA